MQKIIVNGANGYVASHFVKELLCQGFKVVALVRKSVGVSAAQRMKNVLGEIAPGVNPRNLRVYNYSLNEKDYSLTQKQLDTIFEGDVSFFHFAACLKFKSRDRDEIFKTNVDGVKNSVKVFLKHATHKSRFFFVSTAYSCGKISKP
ncbi:MAG TPA: SDR family oxidoreductase, partial [Prolixibacteraceae bacterium]|nr:SDR family oxidoreductase [Prolixibacteraceae bacterium]